MQYRISGVENDGSVMTRTASEGEEAAQRIYNELAESGDYLFLVLIERDGERTRVIQSSRFPALFEQPAREPMAA